MRRPQFANAIALCAIILLALAVRFSFYTGPIGSDDTWYYLSAYDIYDGSYHPPANYWKIRYGMLLPIATFYKLFGANEFSAAMWPMVCSLGAIVVCYFLGKTVLDSQTGLLAALLLAFYPLDIHYSGLILPDIPLSFLMAASVLAFIRGSQSEKYAPILFFVSGLLLAVAFSCRSMAIILLPFLFVYAVLFERKLRPSLSLFVIGFLMIIGAESLYYSLNGLSPLHSFQLNAKAAIAVNQSGECSTSQAYYPTVAFRNVTVFGPYFFLFVPAMVLSLFKRQRGALVFLAWAGIILAILQFGFVSIFPPIPVVKVRKFLNFASIPLVLVAAWALMQLRARFRWAVIVAVAGMSLYMIRGFMYAANQTPESWGGRMRDATAYLGTLPPKPIYADGRTIGMLRLISGFEMEPDRFHDLYDVSSAKELENCYVVINRFYAQFDIINPYANVPHFAATYPLGIPPSWKAKDFLQSVVLDVP